MRKLFLFLIGLFILTPGAYLLGQEAIPTMIQSIRGGNSSYHEVNISNWKTSRLHVLQLPNGASINTPFGEKFVNESKESIEIYPNPVIDKLTIVLKIPDQEGLCIRMMELAFDLSAT